MLLGADSILLFTGLVTQEAPSLKTGQNLSYSVY